MEILFILFFVGLITVLILGFFELVFIGFIVFLIIIGLYSFTAIVPFLLIGGIIYFAIYKIRELNNSKRKTINISNENNYFNSKSQSDYQNNSTYENDINSDVEEVLNGNQENTYHNNSSLDLEGLKTNSNDAELIENLKILGIYSHQQLKKYNLFFYHEKRYREIKNSDINYEQKNKKLIELNNAMDLLREEDIDQLKQLI